MQFSRTNLATSAENSSPLQPVRQRIPVKNNREFLPSYQGTAWQHQEIAVGEQRAAEERRLKKQEQYWRHGNSFGSTNDFHTKAYVEFDTIWSGQLVFQLDGWDYGVRKSWGGR